MGLAFDAWGKRMQPNGTADPDGQLNPASTDRGFTGHEHLDELGFVHMNGRIYDPLLGRFLSPDPHIQDEGLLQNYNRYSYVLNNPLRYTDPSGEVWWHVAAFIVGAALASSNNRDLKVIGTLMMMAALATVNGEPGLLQMLAGKDVVVPATASAFGSAAIANTIAYGPEAGLKAGVFAAAFAFVGGSEAFGELKKVTAERVIAHAVLGCVQQASSGGQCGPGAAAAAFGKIATGLSEGLNSIPAQFAVTTVVGGTVSVIGGGKFANGAAQAGFGYLFNECAHGGCGWNDTKVVITGNYAAGPVGEYGTYPSSLHLEIRIQNSYDIITIEGQPGDYSVMKGLRLVSGSDSPHPAPVFSMELSVPKGMSMQQLATNLVDAAKAYQNNLPYNFPLAGTGTMMRGYNSDSYVSGVLMRATGQYQAGVVEAARKAGFLVPGFNKPMPIGPR